jgi:hypothetical protein
MEAIYNFLLVRLQGNLSALLERERVGYDLLSRDDGEKVTGLQIQGRLTIDYQKLQNTFAASVSARQMFRRYDQL